VNPPGNKKAQYWASDVNPEEAEAWRGVATLREGSWWPDWYEWLGAQSGAEIAPPENTKYPELAAAPGTYVLVK